MHLGSLCVPDTHSLERARVDIDSRKRVRAEYREPVTMMTVTRDEAIEKSRESGTRLRMRGEKEK
jgi:hypothetical protein